jgi:hypothetical protein
MTEFLIWIVAFICGYIVGRTEKGNGWDESHENYERWKKEKVKHEQDLVYYKKLCRTLADENAEFRRNQK